MGNQSSSSSLNSPPFLTNAQLELLSLESLKTLKQKQQKLRNSLTDPLFRRPHTSYIHSIQQIIQKKKIQEKERQSRGHKESTSSSQVLNFQPSQQQQKKYKTQQKSQSSPQVMMNFQPSQQQKSQSLSQFMNGKPSQQQQKKHKAQQQQQKSQTSSQVMINVPPSPQQKEKALERILRKTEIIKLILLIKHRKHQRNNILRNDLLQKIKQQLKTHNIEWTTDLQTKVHNLLHDIQL